MGSRGLRFVRMPPARGGRGRIFVVASLFAENRYPLFRAML
jgi:hypothetical protein